MQRGCSHVTARGVDLLSLSQNCRWTWVVGAQRVVVLSLLSPSYHPHPCPRPRNGTGGSRRRFPFTASNPSTRPRAANLQLRGRQWGRRPLHDACPLVLVQLVATGAGADRARTAVAAAVGAAAIVRLTAVHYLHLDPHGQSHQRRGTRAGVALVAWSSRPSFAASPWKQAAQSSRPSGPGTPSSWGPSVPPPILPGPTISPQAQRKPSTDKAVLALGQSEPTVRGWEHDVSTSSGAATHCPLTVALPAISTQLVARIAHTLEETCVLAGAMRTGPGLWHIHPSDGRDRR